MTNITIKNLKTIADQLNTAGSVILLPTDTQYGLVCRITDKKALNKLFNLKGRLNNAGTILVGTPEQLFDLGVEKEAVAKTGSLWPGAVSVGITCSAEYDYLHPNRPEPVFRIPAQIELRELLMLTGPLMTSSANLHGQKPVATVAEANAIFGDKVDMYVDGGNLGDRLPSTIVVLTDEGYTVVRAGAVKL